jgi:RNA polymerase sigma-70 factor (ECF subfamily)
VENPCVGASSDDRWADLWDRHADDVYAYALRRVGPDDAPDVVAEVFTVAMTRADRVPEDALPWLYRTAWNVVRNLYRTRARHARPVGGPGASADHATAVADREVMLAALATLSERDREVLMLVAWEGLDSQRAAVVAGCSVNAFTVRLHRARARLEDAVRAADEADEEVAP